jgi:diacylglycerol kinase
MTDPMNDPSNATEPAPAEPIPRNELPPRGSILRGFYFAFAGLGFLLRTQRNARIELVIGALACAAGAWLCIGRVEWAIIIFTIALVLILEGLNTAIEAAIDLASPRLHPLAKTAKDLAAGMVLIAAIASVGVGLLILGPPLWVKLFG